MNTLTLDGVTYTVTDPYTIEALRLVIQTYPVASVN